jgi:hypothetical protein
VNAPDYIEPVEAWRVWLVTSEYRLRSVVYDAVWPIEEPLVATCLHRRRRWRAPWREVPLDHGAPDSACTCGSYGADHHRATRMYERLPLPDWAIGQVVGRVALWGDVVECMNGWRASHANPVRICPPEVTRTSRLSKAYTWDDVAFGLTVYGVPVDSSPIVAPASSLAS